MLAYREDIALAESIHCILKGGRILHIQGECLGRDMENCLKSSFVYSGIKISTSQLVSFLGSFR